MKPLRSLPALAFAFILAGSAAFADVGDAKAESKLEKAPCGCAVGKDKKVCGVDTDCCCTGEKATGKKAEEAKGEKDCSACTACK